MIFTPNLKLTPVCIAGLIPPPNDLIIVIKYFQILQKYVKSKDQCHEVKLFGTSRKVFHKGIHVLLISKVYLFRFKVMVKVNFFQK